MLLVASREEYRFSLVKISAHASLRTPLLSNRFHKSNLLVSRVKNLYSWSPLASTPLCACRRTEGGAGAAPGRRSTVPCSGPLQPPPPGRRRRRACCSLRGIRNRLHAQEVSGGQPEPNSASRLEDTELVPQTVPPTDQNIPPRKFIFLFNCLRNRIPQTVECHSSADKAEYTA